MLLINCLWATSINWLTFAILGDVTCKATIPIDMEVEARFLAKEDGIVAGIALAEMVFHEVDPSLKVLKHDCIVKKIAVVFPTLIVVFKKLLWVSV